MSTLSAKILDLFKNLKTDAVPRAPRPPRSQYVAPEEVPYEENNENYDTNNETEGPEVIVIEEVEEPDDDLKKDEKPKKRPSFFTYKSKEKEGKPKPKPNNDEKGNSDCRVNTQAAGSVINIVNSKDIRWGDDYYMGPVKTPTKKTERFMEPEDEAVEMSGRITSLMEAKIKPEHEHLDLISNNLGKNWYSFFISLGYLKGRIETMELNYSREYGVAEARYKLLLDWIRKEEDGSLGRLSTKLWDHGDRALVKELAEMYHKTKNTM